MDKFSSNSELTIERYILGQLSEDEATEFESYYLSNQECLDQLEIAEKLYEGMNFLNQNNRDMQKLADSGKQASNDLAWWKGKIPVWAVAAMLLVTTLPSVVLITQYTGVEQRVSIQDENSGVVSMTSLSLSQLRSPAETKIVIENNQGRNILAFYIDRNIKDFVYPSYSFEISSSTNPGKVYQFSDLKINDKMSTLYVDLGNEQLSKGSYQYLLTGNQSSNEYKTLKEGKLLIK